MYMYMYDNMYDNVNDIHNTQSIFDVVEALLQLLCHSAYMYFRSVHYIHIHVVPSEEEERLVEKVKKLQNELAKAKKDSESQKSIDGMCIIVCTLYYD